MNKSLEQVLNEFREAANSDRHKGDLFETFILNVLKADASICGEFKDIFLWKDWPGSNGEADLGIDLVGIDEKDDLVAIQCKFYAETTQVTKRTIDSFITTSSRRFKHKGKLTSFSRRIIFSTTENWNPNARKSLLNQDPQVSVIGFSDLANSSVDWDKFSLKKPQNVKLNKKKTLRKHQKEALDKVKAGFKESDRGKLIMACGTGKTFTSLKIVEDLNKKGDWILFLVPSISLLSQTLREWRAEAEIDLNCFAICSDTKASKKEEDQTVVDLAFPSTTDSKKLKEYIKKSPVKKALNIVFSTYQSIEVVSKVQKEKVLPIFNLVICDEAHRTTGVTLKGKEQSAFTMVHYEKNIKSKKRLYMTATPRIFGDGATKKASEIGAELCNMDDDELYGPEFHRLGFSEAVKRGLLTDYKVLVLAVDESFAHRAYQKLQISEEGSELKLDDFVKLIGCWNGLSKKTVQSEEGEEIDDTPMKRVVAFSSKIDESKMVKEMFSQTVNEYIEKFGAKDVVLVESDHVDGSMNSLVRNNKVEWLKSEPEENTCKILSNARCLSEGVDVPALDGIMFLKPRKSQIDVVQSVGRVMRLSPGKKYGYVILPIGIPTGMTPEEALADNDKYRVVWEVLQALRAHDDRFNSIVNKIELNKKRPKKIQIIGVGGSGDEGEGSTEENLGFEFDFENLGEWKDAIYAKLVKKCGDRRYWEDWAKDVAKIADNHISKINKLLEKPKAEHKNAFDTFLKGLHQDINPSVTKDEAIEMLAQHLITKPVFDVLFENYDFTSLNPVSKAMNEIVKVLESENIDSNIDQLQKFYLSVKERATGIDNADGKQKIIIELYDKFFRHAFPKVSDKLGIVYTPIELVDFILKSVDSVLNKDFSKTLSDEGVKILDPFTGTGTFIVRLLQSGLVQNSDLFRKYSNEIYANEIVLLAYYIASLNIEEVFHSVTGGAYKQFDGAVLTDTFQIDEERLPLETIMFPENNKRLVREKEANISVVIGNPPYSAKQDSENENNQNLKYNFLDKSIQESYGALSNATNKNNLYDSYIRAFRWATNRIGEEGIIAFVTNGSYVDSKSMDGLRKSFFEDFSKIYCFNLRGNARTQGEQRRKEKGNVFGEGSRAPIAITILVKNKDQEGCELYYHDIGDYLSQEEKLKVITDFNSIDSIPWQRIYPNEDGDWINKRSPEFEKFLSLFDKTGTNHLFSLVSNGALTSRDYWTYNSSYNAVSQNVQKMIQFYNKERERFFKEKAKKPQVKLNDFINNDPKEISWSSSLKATLEKNIEIEFSEDNIVQSSYRPFFKQWLYFDKYLTHRRSQLEKIFPTQDSENIVICFSGTAASKDFSALATNIIPNFHFHDTGQCISRYIYKKNSENQYVRVDGITDELLSKFIDRYDGEITKDDIFYYVYGILHSPEYKTRFKFDLKKVQPRIPMVKNFWKFSKCGKQLMELHINYESVKPYSLLEFKSDASNESKNKFYVEKISYGKTDKKTDISKLIINSNVRIENIPIKSYDYIVNGKPALEWIMERYKVVTDKDSGIKNDPNEWSKDSNYITDLIAKIVTVSLETVKIVESLPKLEEDID